MSMRSIFGLLLVSFLAGGCDKTLTCKENTVFVKMQWTGDAANADSLDVSVSIDGMPSTTSHLDRPASGDFSSIEVDFKTYPAGKSVSVSVDAKKSGVVIASLSGTTVLRGACGALQLSGTAGADLSGSVDAGPDLIEETPPDMVPQLLPKLTIDKPMFDFSTVAIGQSSTASFAITNMGMVASTALAVDLSNATNGVTIDTDGCTGKTLAINDSCAVSVKFAPTAAAAATGTLTVSVTPGNSVTSTLTGTGVTPGAVKLTPSPVPFGSVTNGSSKPLDVTATNTGGASVGPLGTPALTGTDAAQFTITTQNCANATLTSLGTCSITVTAKPTSTGTKSATLSVMAGGSPAVTTLTLTVLGKPGDSCVAVADCGAGAAACVDSRCCTQSACASCTACNVDTSGSCKPVAPGMPDPKGSCTNAPSNCQLSTCNGAGGCAFVAANTVCLTACANGTVTVGQISSSTFSRNVCNGTSAGCTIKDTSPTVPTCNSLVCADNFSCRTTCRYDADCVRSSYCKNGTCVAKGIFGAGCAADDQCVSGVCVSNACADCRSDFPDHSLGSGFLHTPSSMCPPSAPLCVGGHCANACTGNVCVYLPNVSNAMWTYGSCSAGHATDGSSYQDQCSTFYNNIASSPPYAFDSISYGSCLSAGGSCSCGVGNSNLTCHSSRAPTCFGSTCGCGSANMICPPDQFCTAGVCKVATNYACITDGDCASGSCNATTHVCNKGGQGKPCADVKADCADWPPQVNFQTDCGGTCNNYDTSGD